VKIFFSFWLDEGNYKNSGVRHMKSGMETDHKQVYEILFVCLQIQTLQLSKTLTLHTTILTEYAIQKSKL
jgi:hypothetical protein